MAVIKGERAGIEQGEGKAKDGDKGEEKEDSCFGNNMFYNL